MAANPFYTVPVLNSYQSKFDTAVIKPKFAPLANVALSTLIKHKSIYEQIQLATGVPWYFIGCLHMRESGMDFTKHLHNGDSLLKRTVQVPAGRPIAPPKNGKSYTFIESAIDSLTYQGLTKWTDWSIPGMIYKFELYNGTGYIKRGRTNPYLWSGTQWYSAGKYVSDGIYSATAIDKQLGAVSLLVAFSKAYPQYFVEVKKKANFKLPSVITDIGSSFWDFVTLK